ncbi:MAG: hypothetical protein ACUVTL_09280 [Thermoproteota archaeon]
MTNVLEQARLRAVVLMITVCLMGLSIESTKAITFSYYTYASANFDDRNSDDFTLSEAIDFSNITRSVSGYSLNASGIMAEAKASRSFFQIRPPYKISFETSIRLHINTSLPLEFAYLKVGSSPFLEVRLLRTGSGKLGVLLNSTTISETTKVINLKSWQSITIIYDPSAANVEVYANDSLAYSSTSFSAYLNNSLVVSFGVQGNSSSRSRGEVLLDNFVLSLSPILEAEKPICSPGDEVNIFGYQFSPGSNISITVKDPSGKTVKSLTVQLDSSCSFAIDLKLSSTAPLGKYEISAVDPERGTVKSSFGVWACSKSKVQRAELFTFSGGGLRGNTTINIAIYRGSIKVKQLSLTTTSTGSFSTEYEFPPDADVGIYSATISGTGTADYPSRSFSDSTSFELILATLNIDVQTNSSVYNRTQTMSVTAQITYPDGSPIPSSSLVQISLYLRQALVTPVAKMTYNSASKRWIWRYTFSPSAYLGNYTIAISASDVYDNSGSSNRSVKVEAATLSIIIFDLREKYQRTEIINISALISYPDGSLVTSGNFKIRLKAPTGAVREAQIFYDRETGRWCFPKDEPYRIPVDETTGLWTLTLTGKDYSNNPGEGSSSISIQRATISILNAAINSSYPRTSRIVFRIKPVYPGGSTLTSGNVVVMVSTANGRSYYFPLTLEDGKEFWTGEAIIGRDFSLGTATLNLTASDRFQNSGFWAESFNITLAVLKVSIMAERSEIQIGFDSLRLIGNITYPDGSPLKDGIVVARISAGDVVLKNLNLTYNEGVGWTSLYSPSIFEPSGFYFVNLTARDAYGNMGQTFIRVNASQTLLFGVIALVLLSITIGIVLWLRSRRRSIPPSRYPMPELGLMFISIDPISFC